MKKGIFILTLLILALFSVSCIYASDVNDTLAASENTEEIELSHEIESADDNLGTIEEQTVTQTDNEEKTGATDDGTFWALQSKIGSASSEDTVYLENNYSCEDSWTQEEGIDIYTSNLVIDGQGHTIDAKQKTRIFDVYYAENVTIKNIKFINAKYDGSGGAIDWYLSANGRVSGCSFVNCAADGTGGAIYWELDSVNGIISDCVFINSTDYDGKAINIAGSASLDRNWFGNTAENYETSPNAYIYGAVPDNWLFLNATVDPDSISIAETADIIFKLYLYNSNSGNITDYTSLAKVDLALNSNGKLDKYVEGLGEKFIYTPTSSGTGNITATIGNVAYTTTLTVNTAKTKLFADPITAAYNSNKKMVIALTDINGKPLSGVKVTVKIKSDKTYTTDANGQIKINVANLVPNTYTVKITFNGDANYDMSSKDVKVTVTKATPKLTAKAKSFKKSVKTKKYTVTLKDNNGKAMKKVKLTLKVKGKTYKAKTNSKGKATFKIKKLTKKGTYKAKVKFAGNAYYNAVTKTVKIKIK